MFVVQNAAVMLVQSLPWKGDVIVVDSHLKAVATVLSSAILCLHVLALSKAFGYRMFHLPPATS
jgi:hypothetical protein